MRWAVAIVVVALVVVASGVAAVLLTGRAPASEVQGWVPKGSVIYAELRLDLPGDQRAKLGEFLARFPGFEDQAALDTKLDEVLDRVIGAASDGTQTFRNDIEPWFGGEIALGLGELPDASSLDEETMPEFHGLGVLSVTDGAKARAWFEKTVDGTQPTTETYNGVELLLYEAKDTRAAGTTGAFAIAGGVALIGDVGSVKQAIDTNGDSGLAEDENFAAATAALTEDHIAYFFLDTRAYFEWAMDLSSEMEGSTDMSAMSDALVALMPPWTAIQVRVEGDALVAESRSPAPEKRLGPEENRTSVLAKRVPASTIVYGELHDYGAQFTDMLTLYEDMPGFAEGMEEFETALDMFGGLDGLIGWIGDTAFIVTGTDDGGVELGLVVSPTDAEKAGNLFSSLRMTAGLGGAQMGLTIDEDEHGDATITTLDFGNLETLMGASGSEPGDIDFFGGPDAHMQISWTVTDDLVVVGASPGFVTSVLDTEESASLAADDRFEGLVGRVGGDGISLAFADVAAIRTYVEKVLAREPDMLAEYEREVKPFLEPFDAFVSSNVLAEGDELDRGTMVMTISE